MTLVENKETLTRGLIFSSPLSSILSVPDLQHTTRAKNISALSSRLPVSQLNNLLVFSFQCVHFRPPRTFLVSLRSQF